MKILDRYVAKNYLTGYAIAFCVLIGLRIILDLFVNIDEFNEHADLGAWAILKNIFIYYSINCSIYFRDFAGVIVVVAAVFSLGRMVRSNELVAVMASGVSLKRVIAPIIILSILLMGLLVIDQEFIIPALADKLVRGQDALPGEETYDVWFIADGKGSLICSQKFDVKTSTFQNPTIITRSRKDKSLILDVTGLITAEKASYENDKWVLTSGQYNERKSGEGPKSIESYESDIIPKDIPTRRKSRHKTLLSWSQLYGLTAQGTKIKDIAQLYAQMHFHVTDPIINIVMLMVSLPVLVCRDPKAMKSAILIGFVMTTGCFITTFICKMFAMEVLFDVRPELWAWLPVLIFLPIAAIQLDSMKT